MTQPQANAEADDNIDIYTAMPYQYLPCTQ
jgi:hypothetical protein